ncbi:hypothetical protein LWF01_10235 [Saxibacter everestensis]|uniref:Uncharacterized protein n=1 Tax=Saxibacter everestensis TaxID=2909229 RepID=A0ABY8R0D7_9MICO|nr:hypothetical protein LWF01_10235 [Brevibacteriaceae bacterium ZFBP1038]
MTGGSGCFAAFASLTEPVEFDFEAIEVELVEEEPRIASQFTGTKIEALSSISAGQGLFQWRG